MLSNGAPWVKVFRGHCSSPAQSRVVDAIPDSSPAATSSSPAHAAFVPVSELIGMELPPRRVTNLLLDSYLKALHWHLLLFHESALRAELDPILGSGMASHDRRPFLMLVLIILVIGARYVDPDVAQQHCPGVDFPHMHTKMLEKAEENFLAVFDASTVESVSFSILLASLYLYNRRPRRSIVVMGAGVRCAQAMNLHRESSWGNIDTVTREVRRRVFWALYVCDGYVNHGPTPRVQMLKQGRFQAMTYGRPCMLHATDLQVEMPVDMDDTCTPCPGFESLELLANGAYEPVTTGSYHRYKSLLYMIAEPITSDMYFQKNRTMKDLVKQVKEVHRRLLDWEKRIPPELRLKSLARRQIGDVRADRVLDTFRLQALALQLSYDNVQLLLHRLMITYKGGHQIPLPLPDGQQTRDGEETVGAGGPEGDISRVSRNQCWESAMRTSLIDESPAILDIIRHTPVGAYIGIQAFTAGVMLGIFALSNPFSSQAQESKRGIARLIRIPGTMGFHDAVWEQCAGILEDLVRLILTEEMKTLISEDQGTTVTNQGVQIPSFGASRPIDPSIADVPLRRTELTDKQHDGSTTASDGTFDRPYATASTMAASYVASSNHEDHHHQLNDMVDSSYSTTVPSMSPTGNFDDALTSLQHGKHCFRLVWVIDTSANKYV